MAYVWTRWLAAEFRAAGLNVVEVAGWENRGRPASTGGYNPRGLIVDHHTGTRATPSSPAPSLQTLIIGRPDLPGPLCQYATGYDGTIYVIAAGRANVNGKKRVVPNWPESDGNEQMGNEVMTDGTQVLSPAQVRSIAVSNAVVLRHYGRSAHGYVYRHEDISLSGKWDLGNRSTPQLRADVDKYNLEDDDMALTDAQEKALAQIPQLARDMAAVKEWLRGDPNESVAVPYATLLELRAVARDVDEIQSRIRGADPNVDSLQDILYRVIDLWEGRRPALPEEPEVP